MGFSWWSSSSHSTASSEARGHTQEPLVIAVLQHGTTYSRFYSLPQLMPADGDQALKTGADGHHFIGNTQLGKNCYSSSTDYSIRKSLQAFTCQLTCLSICLPATPDTILIIHNPGSSETKSSMADSCCLEYSSAQMHDELVGGYLPYADSSYPRVHQL